MVKNGFADGFIAPTTKQRLLFANAIDKDLIELKLQAYTLKDSSTASKLMQHDNELSLYLAVQLLLAYTSSVELAISYHEQYQSGC